MSGLVRVCSESELPPNGEAREIVAAGRHFCVAQVAGEVSVLEGICPHQQGPLGQGIVENGRIVCPWHAWAFDLHTGEALHTPRAKVRVYEAGIADGELFVKP
jgi:nitrite reductase (NADH) small subunit